MSLIKCKECGREISTSADTCPHCGNLSSVKKAMKVSTDIMKAGCAITLLVPVVLIIAVIIMIAVGEKP